MHRHPDAPHIIGYFRPIISDPLSNRLYNRPDLPCSIFFPVVPIRHKGDVDSMLDSVSLSSHQERLATEAYYQEVQDTCKVDMQTKIGVQVVGTAAARVAGRGYWRYNPFGMGIWAARRSYNTDDTRDVRGSGSKGFVKIVEVGARDGLQNIPGPPVPTDIKAELVKRLHSTGLQDIEVGSFVRPDRVPQMADTPDLLQALRETLSGDKRPNYQVLVPNMKGLDNLIALEEQVKNAGLGKLTSEIALFVPASDQTVDDISLFRADEKGFCKANNGTTVDKLLSSIPAVVEKALKHGYRVRGYVSVVIACPYDGKVTPEKVRKVTEVLDRIGCYEISLGDTTGQGSPESWKALWSYLEKSGLDMSKVAVHVGRIAHDTFATSLASIASLLPHGLRIVDSSVAGLGGCPYSPGATGNVATEDVVHLLHELGYSTGVDLDQLAGVGKWITDSIGRTNESRVGRAICARASLA